jgi:beta-glucosidase
MRPARSPEFPELRNNAYRIRAGVDVLMPGSMSHVLVVRDKPAGISRAELQQSARRVLALLMRMR